MAKPVMPTTCFYIYLAKSPASLPAPSTVFYCIDDAALAEQLCELFNQEYGTDTCLSLCASSESVSPQDQLLFDEALDELRLYDDPDPGIYDITPTQQTLDCAQFAIRLQRWEDLLRARLPAPQQEPRPENRDIDEPAQQLEEALLALHKAVDHHRLTFLFFANPRRFNPLNLGTSWETLYRDEHPQTRIPVEAVDDDGEFLFKYRWTLDCFAQTAISRFGPGDGDRAVVIGPEGEFVPVEGGSQPHWSLDEIACQHLEQSSDRILNACKQLLRMDARRQFHELIQHSPARHTR
ncbi:MAG TPA: hypothetical protein VGN12_07640 [Pirellulales bacterium]